jgi:serine/threonine protein kinase
VIVRAKGDERDPEDFNSAGTPAYRAPEQVVKGEDDIPEAPTARTDVFGLGMLMFSVMELIDGDELLAWDPDLWNEEPAGPLSRDEPEFSNRSKKLYSKELRKLVLDCARYSSADRLSFLQILKRIGRYSSDEDHSKWTQGLRDAEKGDERRAQITVKVPAEQFPMGVLLQDFDDPRKNWHFPGKAAGRSPTILTQ